MWISPDAYGLDVGEDEGGTWIGHSGGMVGYTRRSSRW